MNQEHPNPIQQLISTEFNVKEGAVALLIGVVATFLLVAMFKKQKQLYALREQLCGVAEVR